MIQYYSPNLNFASLIKALFIRKAEDKIISYFKDYTDKRFVVVTGSCRSSLYLTYKSLKKNGIVITNPLTCNVSLEPIVGSGNQVVYTDVDKNTLTMLTSDFNKIKDGNVIAIQANHQGGFFCDMGEVKKHIGSSGIYLIEDCAQGFMSSYNGHKPGAYSDIVCFSLIKNAFGIGGGVLATNDREIFQYVSDLKQNFREPPLLLIIFRVLRNLLESKRNIGFVDFFYTRLMNMRGISNHFSNKKSNHEYEILPSKIEMQIGYEQITKAKRLNLIRKQKGEMLLEKLKSKCLINNYMDITKYDSSFVKFLVVNRDFKSREYIELLNKKGIEVKHLEHKYNQFYQERLDRSGIPELVSNISECPNYLEVYDTLFSLPLFESMKEDTMDKMVKILEELLQNEKHYMV